jgi:hypothetical protein
MPFGSHAFRTAGRKIKVQSTGARLLGTKRTGCTKTGGGFNTQGKSDALFALGMGNRRHGKGDQRKGKEAEWRCFVRSGTLLRQEGDSVTNHHYGLRLGR